MNSIITKALILIASLAIQPIAAAAGDQLVVISPHRKSIQDEFIPPFKKFYKEKYGKDLQVDWLSQGGTTDNVRFVSAKFAKTPKTTGVDIFWGGGVATFIDLKNSGFLAKHTLNKSLSSQIPAAIAGVPIYDAKDQQWYGTAMSSFGIFFNKKLLKFDGLPTPKTWDDLAKTEYYGQLTLTDPRRSGTASSLNNIMIQSEGWEKAWALLTKIGGNTRKFTHSSSDPIKAIVAGDTAICLSIDFFASSKIQSIGEKNLGFTLPEGQTVIDPDPISILKGAPNRVVAERFIDFVLSAQGQSIFAFKKGIKSGPRLSTLGRMAVNKKLYADAKPAELATINPFSLKAFLKLDVEQAAKRKRVLNDIIGTYHVDNHRDLKKAWKNIGKHPKLAEYKELVAPPITAKQLDEYASKWDDEVFRNKNINLWINDARARYSKVARLKLAKGKK